MAKSIRSKSKRKFRAIKRAAVFQPVADIRLQRCTARLHKDSKVCHVDEPEPDPPSYSFSFKEALIDAPNAAKLKLLASTQMDTSDDVQNTTYGDAAEDTAERKASAPLKQRKKKGKSYNKNTGIIFRVTGKDGKKRSILKW